MCGTVSFQLCMFSGWMPLDPPGSSAEPTAPVAGCPLCPGVEEGL